MPPTRTRDTKAGEPSNPGLRKQKKLFQPKEAAVPGVSKLKSALRQARRLLAKDNLAANVRVETERRVKALEADLAKAEVAHKERTLAMRYHKVKFFDRQKLVRKIKQTKKQLDASDLSSNARKLLEAKLFDLRVDLNYVMNYPKTEKYISLFPPEVRHGGSAEPVHAAPSAEKTATDAKREELRDWIRKRMQASELSAEPETLQRAHAKMGTDADIWRHDEVKVVKGKGKAIIKQIGALGVQSDEFFEDEEAEDEAEVAGGQVAEDGEAEDEDMVSEDMEEPPVKAVKKRSRKEEGSSRKKSKKNKGADGTTSVRNRAAVEDDFFAEAESAGSDASK